MKAFQAVGGIKELGDLVQTSPGITAFTLFIVLKFLEELGTKAIWDPRLAENYDRFWLSPSAESAKHLFESGLAGAALWSIGKGIETLWVKHRAGLANLLDTRHYQPE